MKINRIIRRIEKFDVISFDVFDTLIERKVEVPTDIFTFTAKKVPECHDLALFKEKRIQAEVLARKKSVHNGEVTLSEIYQELAYYGTNMANSFENAEEETELESCVPKKSIKNVYNWAVQNHKKILIISDMYLSSKLIGKMLKKCGYSEYIKVCVSNEYGANKISGQLFRNVMDEFGISSEQMIHIGDSVKADFLGAKKAHISSILISRTNRWRRFVRNRK